MHEAIMANEDPAKKLEQELITISVIQSAIIATMNQNPTIEDIGKRAKQIFSGLDAVKITGIQNRHLAEQMKQCGFAHLDRWLEDVKHELDDSSPFDKVLSMLTSRLDAHRMQIRGLNDGYSEALDYSIAVIKEEEQRLNSN